MGSGERVLVPTAEPCTNVVGERNYQAAIRQAVGVEAAAEERLHLISVLVVPEPDNEFDLNAIAVRSLAGDTLGYLPAALAKLVSLAEPMTAKATVNFWQGRFVITLHVERRDASKGDERSPCP